MPKSKFFRVAVSGPTIDGRIVKSDWLRESAKNYSTDNYTARINLEHFLAFSPSSEFRAYGDVLELKAEPFYVDHGGKSYEETALYARIEVNDDVVAMNKKGQKVFTSCEFTTDYRKTGEAYLVGLALTDRPASLSTQRIHFNQAYNNADNAELSYQYETEIDFSDRDVALNEDNKANKSFFNKLVSGIKPFKNDRPSVEQKTNGRLSAVTGHEEKLRNDVEKAFEGMEAFMVGLDKKVSDLEHHIMNLSNHMDKVKDPSHRDRPPADGSNQSEETYL